MANLLRGFFPLLREARRGYGRWLEVPFSSRFRREWASRSERGLMEGQRSNRAATPSRFGNLLRYAAGLLDAIRQGRIV